MGRPPKYNTVEELEARIEEYFNYCDNKTKEVHSEKLGDMILPDPEPYTMAGLAYWVGLSRQGLIEYKNKNKEFSDAIKKARNRVEADVERRMSHKDTFTPGLIFNAKNNFGWKDKTETDITSGGEKIRFLNQVPRPK
ncbi:MAG: DNA-packaging protein [Thaumarchaeota archaeon]|nr:DNA-packaging protein [Nitrososphaerota archaeon]